MAYTKQTWVDNNSAYPLSAARMNYIEQGIEDAHALVGGGGTSPIYGDGMYTKTVAGAGESASVKAACDYVCTGTNDHTVINTALNSVGVTTLNKGGNGGTVVLVGRNFNIAGSVRIPSQTQLVGAYGKSGTWLTRSGGWSPGVATGMIELYDEDTQYTSIRHLGLNGGGASVTGIYLHNDRAQEFDAFHTVNDVYIFAVGGDGLATILTNVNGNGRMRGGHFSQIRVINCGRYAYYIASNDGFYDRCDTGSAGSHGFYVTNGNNRIVNSKAWYSDGSGFYISGVRTQLAACESQDNLMHGYYLAGAQTNVTGCTADSNSYAGGSTGGNLYDGFNIAAHTIVQGCTAYDKNEGGRGLRQRYGYNITNSSAKVIVDGLAWQNVTGPLNGSGAAGSAVRVVNV